MGAIAPEPGEGFLLVAVRLFDVGIITERCHGIALDLGGFVELTVGILGGVVLGVGLDWFRIGHNDIQRGDAFFNQQFAGSMKKSFDLGVIRIGQEARKTGSIGNPSGIESAHLGQNRTAFQVANQLGNVFDISRPLVDQCLEIGGTAIPMAAELGKIRLVVD